MSNNSQGQIDEETEYDYSEDPPHSLENSGDLVGQVERQVEVHSENLDRDMGSQSDAGDMEVDATLKEGQGDQFPCQSIMTSQQGRSPGQSMEESKKEEVNRVRKQEERTMSTSTKRPAPSPLKQEEVKKVKEEEKEDIVLLKPLRLSIFGRKDE